MTDVRTPPLRTRVFQVLVALLVVIAVGFQLASSRLPLRCDDIKAALDENIEPKREPVVASEGEVFETVEGLLQGGDFGDVEWVADYAFAGVAFDGIAGDVNVFRDAVWVQSDRTVISHVPATGEVLALSGAQGGNSGWATYGLEDGRLVAFDPSNEIVGCVRVDERVRYNGVGAPYLDDGDTIVALDPVTLERLDADASAEVTTARRPTPQRVDVAELPDTWTVSRSEIGEHSIIEVRNGNDNLVYLIGTSS